jgi:hypothetical protein
MGFLDNTTITVDAILTRKGREKLARNGNFNITKYAFADDEIDYNLYDVSHPQGSSYYGAVLENMPLLEAFIDETQVMRYKLFTADKDLPSLANLTDVQTPMTLGANGQGTIKPRTENYGIGELYTFTILNTDVASLVAPDGRTGSFSRNGRSQVIRDASEVQVNFANLQNSTTTVFTTVVLIQGQTTGASSSTIIKNNSTGQFS